MFSMNMLDLHCLAFLRVMRSGNGPNHGPALWTIRGEKKLMDGLDKATFVLK